MTKKQSIAWLTVVYTALLTTLCLVRISAPMPETKVIGFDKLIHFGIYFGLNTLLIAIVIARKSKAATKQIIATTAVAIVYGVAIEFIQEQVGRDFDLYDIVANSLGAISAGVLMSIAKLNRFIAKICK